MIGEVHERDASVPSLPQCPSSGFPPADTPGASGAARAPSAREEQSKEKNSSPADEADAMLAQMSPDDVSDALQEIHSHFSEQSLNFLRSRRQKAKHYSSQPADPSMRSEPKNQSDTKLHNSAAARVRFDLSGKPVACMAFASEGAAVLPTQRDQLRASGVDHQLHGYSLDEAIALARSSVPQQRSAALQLLANVCASCHRAISRGESVCWGDATWLRVFEHAFCNLNLLRAATDSLSERNASVIASSALLLEQVARPPPSVRQHSATASEGHAVPESLVPEQPLWRNKRGQPLEPLAENADEDDPVQESSDPVAALIRMSAADRVAEMVSSHSLPPSQSAPLLNCLCCCARHSNSACASLVQTNNLVPTLVSTYAAGMEQSDLEDSSELREAEAQSRRKSIELLRLIASASTREEHLIPSGWQNAALQASMQHAVYALSSQEIIERHFVGCREPLALWRTLTRCGMNSSCFDDFFGAFEPWISSPMQMPVSNLRIAREVFWTLAVCAEYLPKQDDGSLPVLSWHCAGIAVSHALQLLSNDVIEQCCAAHVDEEWRWEYISTVSAALRFLALVLQKQHEVSARTTSEDGEVPPGFHQGIHAFAGIEKGRLSVISKDSTIVPLLSLLTKYKWEESVDVLRTERCLAFIVGIANLTLALPEAVPDLQNVERVWDILERSSSLSALSAAEDPTPAAIQRCTLAFDAVFALCQLDTSVVGPLEKLRMGSLAAACAPPGRASDLLMVLPLTLAHPEVIRFSLSEVSACLQSSCKQADLLDEGDEAGLEEISGDVCAHVTSLWQRTLGFTNGRGSNLPQMSVEGSILPLGADWLRTVRCVVCRTDAEALAVLQSECASMWKRSRPQAVQLPKDSIARMLSGFVSLDEQVWRLSGAARASLCVLLEQMTGALCQGDEVCGPDGSTQEISMTAEAQELCEQFAAVSYGDGVYGAIVTLLLRPSLVEKTRLGALQSLASLGMALMLPPAEAVFGLHAAEMVHDRRNRTERMRNELLRSVPEGKREQSSVVAQIARTLPT